MLLKIFASLYTLEFIGAIIVILLGVFIWDKRYKKQSSTDIPPGFIKTDEVNIDPITNKKQRVYYNPSNGERLYIDEK